MAKKAPTVAERLHMSRVAALGCVVCRNAGHGPTPAAIHHIREQQGIGSRASHLEVLPLCPPHHQTGGFGVAFHAGKKTWEAVYGTERELLAQIADELSKCGG